MRKHRLAAAGVATLLALSLTATACGTRSEPGNGSGAGQDETKVVKIGVIAPLSGDLSALGLGIKNSVDLAIKQANESKAIPGWTIEIAAEDDQALPDVGQNAATSLSSDPEVAGVVGTLNSSVAQTVQPVLDSANIVQVSPANTGVALTQGEDPDAPSRPYGNYFRVCANDIVQGALAAKYLYEDAGIKKLATIHDKKAYGQGLVESMSAEFEKLGGQIVAAQTINPDDSNFTPVISAVKAKNPQAVYYGGEYPQAGPLSQQMKAAGLDVPLMGGDGIYDPAFIEQAGKTSDGDLASSVGAPPETLDTAKKFISDYEAAGYPEPYAAYGAYSYDAANTIINALKTSLADAEDVESAREATIEAVQNTDFEGATGQVKFDEFGDSVSQVLTVYEVSGGEWKTVKTFE